MADSRMHMSRRDLLKLGLLGTAALYLPVERVARASDWEGLRPAFNPYTKIFSAIPSETTYPRLSGDVLDLRPLGNLAHTPIECEMRRDSANILGYSGTTRLTEVWNYFFKDPTSGAWLRNPTIHVDKGQEIWVRQRNLLPNQVSVHLHGSGSKPQYDGYASDIIPPNHYKNYVYPNQQGARTLWYHDHGEHYTATNAYKGLAGQYHLHDAAETKLGTDKGLPTGAYDFPLTIRDAIFNSNGSLRYDDEGHSSLMGDVIVCNGVPWPNLRVERRMYRFRVLNASLSRSFNFRLNDPNVTGSKAKMWIVASDGGFLQSPVPVTSWRHGMAERYEVVIDFSKCTRPVDLVSGEVKNNVDYLHTRKIMRFTPVGAEVTGLKRDFVTTDFYQYYKDGTVTQSKDPLTGQPYLLPHEITALASATNVPRRRLEFERGNGMWTVNDKTWADVKSSGYKDVGDRAPKLGDVEIWNFENGSGGWFHPIHVHQVDFVLTRRSERSLAAYEKGPKDVAYVGENETATAVMKFGPHEGRYMIHCHNLVHEDHDMMAQFRVGTDKPDNDPMYAAKATTTPTQRI